MLTPDEQQRIIEKFRLYEHDWTFAACYLGEPFLVRDCLTYYDGRIVNVAAFKINDVRGRLAKKDVEAVLSEVAEGRRIDLVHIWGRFEQPAEILFNGRHLRQVDATSSRQYGGEFTIDTSSHDLKLLPEARKAIRAASNKGYTSAIAQRNLLLSEHYRLIEEWVQTRPIGAPSVSAMVALPAYIRNSHVHFIEVYSGSEMRGFGVLSVPTQRDAVLIATFSERYKGARVEDRLMAEAIEFCKRRELRLLHLGYSGTDSLTHFKMKWGAVQTGPNFGEAVYCVTDIAEMASNYTFFWPSRLHGQTSTRGRSREAADM